METMIKKTKPKEEIRVVIPYKGKKFNLDKYTNNKNCYLAEELKKKGCKDVTIGPFGRTKIGDSTYFPTKEFHSGILELAFKQGESVEVILIKS